MSGKISCSLPESFDEVISGRRLKPKIMTTPANKILWKSFGTVERIIQSWLRNRHYADMLEPSLGGHTSDQTNGSIILVMATWDGAMERKSACGLLTERYHTLSNGNGLSIQKIIFRKAFLKRDLVAV